MRQIEQALKISAQKLAYATSIQISLGRVNHMTVPNIGLPKWH